MLRSVLGNLYRNNLGSVGTTTRSFSVPRYNAVPPPVHAGYVPPRIAPEDMPFLHHGKRPRYKKYPKFKLPHKRANKVMNEITAEAIAKNKASKPEVWDTQFRVGDAIEVETVVGGGTATNKTEKLRGVVMGIFRKKLDQSILIREYSEFLLRIFALPALFAGTDTVQIASCFGSVSRRLKKRLLLDAHFSQEMFFTENPWKPGSPCIHPCCDPSR